MNTWPLDWFVVKFLWKFGVLQSKKISFRSIRKRFLWAVSPGSAKCCLIKTSDLNDEFCISNEKLSYPKVKGWATLKW